MSEHAWWKTSGPVLRISAKFDGLTLNDITGMLPRIHASGFSVVEVFAPYHGGREYHGLDGIDFCAIDPAIGTWDDFSLLVSTCHALGLRITVFLNLGYTALVHPAFVKAQRDVRDGLNTQEREWFLWSVTLDRQFEKPLAPWFLQDAHGEWAFSETAGCYYWCKWFGDKGNVRLPQLNFSSLHWQQECQRIVETWRDAGVDGMIVDAVNWYMGCDWEINRKSITGPALNKGAIYLQPEGAGGFLDDPMPWLEKGGYNSVQDYALNLWWEGADVLGDAIRHGNPSGLEVKLCGYRDRVVAAGGVTYASIGFFREATPEERLLETAFLLAAGEVVYVDYGRLVQNGAFVPDAAHCQLFLRQREHKALAPASERIRLHTNDDSRYYAVKRQMDGEKMLVILNFARTREWIEVIMPGGKRLLREAGPLETLWEIL